MYCFCGFFLNFFWSHSNLPSNSNNSTEFDDPTLIQNIEKNHVGVSEAEAYLKPYQKNNVLILCIL